MGQDLQWANGFLHASSTATGHKFASAYLAAFKTCTLLTLGESGECDN